MMPALSTEYKVKNRAEKWQEQAPGKDEKHGLWEDLLIIHK